MKNFEHFQQIFDDQNIFINDTSLTMVRELFCSYEEGFLNDHVWNSFLKTLGCSRMIELIELTGFYYRIVQPLNENGICDELRLIAIASLIEKMMASEKFKTFFEWYKDAHGQDVISDLTKAKEEYDLIFGCTKKIRNYFSDYLDPRDQKLLIGSFDKVMSIEKIANWFYQMRNEFVHQAKLRNFCPSDVTSVGVFVNKKPIMISVTIEQFINIFEKSFVIFWKRKASVLG